MKLVSLDPRERNEPHKIINIFAFYLLIPLSMEVFIQPPKLVSGHLPHLIRLQLY